MRIFIVIIAFLFIGNVFGQIDLKPLDSNPVLESLHNESRRNKIDFIANHHIRAKSVSVIRDSKTFSQRIMRNGDTLKICVDTTKYFGGGAFSIIESPDNTVLDSTCVTYIPGDVTYWREDTIILQTCNVEGECDTLIYPVLLRRNDRSVVGGQTIIQAYENMDICFSELIDVDDFRSSSFGDCDFSDFRTNVTLADTCLLYEAGGSSDVDEVCVVVCTNHLICDTVKFDVFVQSDTLIGLPFFDDFSYKGPFPSRDNWVTQDVYINPTLGINPPSVGVASFDGVSDKGAAYGTSFGVSDQLTSRYIDLSAFASDQGLNLIFFLQPKGLAYSGPEDKDHFLLEYKDVSGKWVVQGEWAPKDEIFSTDNFTQIVVPINKSQFVHSGFQFRFSNLSKRTGFISIWNLDYVLLDKIEGDAEIKDVAFVYPPSSILKNYAHMPWKQMVGNEENEIADNVNISLFSQFDNEVAAEPSTLNISELVAGSDIVTNEELLRLDGSVNQRNVPPNLFVSYSNPMGGRSGLINSLKSDFSGQDSLVLEMEYNFKQSSESNLTNGNNTVKRQTFLTDFYAYDDGSPEGNMTAAGPGTEILLKFHANKPDTIRSIQFFIPHIRGDVSGQRFNIKVYGSDLSQEPLYETGSIRPIYADLFINSINNFTNYKLKDVLSGEDTPILIPTGDFYVGWEQVSTNTSNAIPIGYDLNTNEVSNMKWRKNNSDEWHDFPETLPGVVMIRPVFSEIAEPTTDNKTVVGADFLLQISPNPNNGYFYVNIGDNDFEHFEMEIYNGLGQLIQNGILKSTIDLTKQVDGIYFIKVLDIYNGVSQTFRMIKQ